MVSPDVTLPLPPFVPLGAAFHSSGFVALACTVYIDSRSTIATTASTPGPLLGPVGSLLPQRQAILVGATFYIAAVRLLRTYIGWRTHQQPRLGQVLSTSGPKGPGYGEIGDQCPTIGQKNVFGLAVAVHEPMPVGVVEPGGDRSGN